MSLCFISINAFMVWIFMSGVKKNLYPTILSSKYFTVLAFTFTYLPRPRTDLCVWCKAQFSYRKSKDLILYNEKSIICPLTCDAISIINQVFLPISLFLASLFCSMGQFFHRFTNITVLMTTAFWWLLITGETSPTSLFHRNILTVWGLFIFSTNLKVFTKISLKIFSGTASNPQINLRSNIFRISCFNPYT